MALDTNQETVSDTTEEVVDQLTSSQETQVESTIEDRAREQGWRPKKEFDGPKDKWVSAETFIAKGELIEKIEALGKELKSQKKANQMLLEHHQKVKESEFKHAVEFLKQQKKQAYEIGDVDKIIEIDDQIANVRETQKQQAVVQQQEQQSELHPEFQSWVSENKWYERDTEMRETADALGIAHAQKHKELSPSQVLKYVEGQIKKLYKDKFENQNRTRPSSVEGVGSGAIGNRISANDRFDMTEEEKQVMMSFARAGIMSKEDYIKELKSMRGVK